MHNQAPVCFLHFNFAQSVLKNSTFLETRSRVTTRVLRIEHSRPSCESAQASPHLAGVFSFQHFARSVLENSTISPELDSNFNV